MFERFSSFFKKLPLDFLIPDILTPSETKQNYSYPNELSDELAGRKLGEIQTTLQNLTQACREHKLKRKHRTKIIDEQDEILEWIIELTGNQRNVRYWPQDDHPTLNQLADVFEEALTHAQPEHAIKVRTVRIADKIAQHAQEIYDELETHPEFKYAYSERYIQTQYGHEIQSSGIPDGIDLDNIEDGGEPQEVYACGRALEGMEELARHSDDTPLWIGVDTRSGKDVSLEKNVLFRHRAIFGQTGYGKSTLLMNDAKQLIESGAGVCIIDPKGDDSRRLMQLIPEERMDDVLWIEPSSSGEYISGFNYITMGIDQNDPNYEVARANLVEDLKKMLKMNAEYWGPRMDRVAMNLITAMNMYNDRTPDDAPEMNLVDLYYILKSEASRKEFAARCKKAGLRFVDDYTAEIADMSDDDLEPLLGRFLPWIQNPQARRMIGFREGGINIPKAIGNDRIIIVRMGQEPRDLKQMLGMAVIRRIWSRIRSRAEQAEHARKPFYLFVDEFDNIALRDETIPSIISESRSYRLSLTVANQYPDQLPQNVINAITTNCDTIMSFNPGDEKAARTYNTQLGLDPETLTDESNYHIWMRTTVNSNMEKSDAFRTYVFPPHPPYRTMDDAQTWINRSLKRYGRQRRSDEETYMNLLFNGGDGKWETGIGKEIELAEEKDMVRGLEVQLEQEVPLPDEPAVGGEPDEPGANPFGPSNDESDPTESSSGGQRSGDPVEEYREEILESIFATALRLKDDPQAPVPTAEVKERMVDRLPDDVGDSLSELSNLFEKLDGEYAKTKRLSGEVNIKLTNSGEAKVFAGDTGSAGSGGGDHHRWVLRECYAAFTKIGYETSRPHQEGDELPDGVAEPPVDIRDIDPNLPPSEFTKEIDKRKERLQTKYPEVWKFSEGDSVSIEAETSTVETPFQTFNNLIKSQKKGSLCVFALKDGEAKQGDFGYWGQRVEQAIYETVRPPGGNSEIVSREPTFRKPRPSADANPRFYTYSSGHYKLDEDRTALRPKTDAQRSVWYLDEDTGEVVCAPSNGEQPIEEGDEIRFENRQAVAEGDPTAVPAYYEYDASEQQYVVNASGEELKYNSEEELEQDWERFRGAFIPENEFDGMPTEDDFKIVIFADENSSYDQPQIYEYGECRPLFDELGMDASIPTGDSDIKHVDVESIDDDPTVDEESEPAETESTDTAGEDTPDDTAEDGMVDTEPVVCAACEHQYQYNTTADGQVPDPCPECGSDAVGVVVGDNQSDDPAETDTDAAESPDNTASPDETTTSDEAAERDENAETADTESTDTGDTERGDNATGGDENPPRNIKPHEITNHSSFDRCDAINAGEIPSIATGLWTPDADTEKFNQLVACIGRVHNASAEYIDEPSDLKDVIGNPQNDQTTREADTNTEPNPEPDQSHEQEHEQEHEQTAETTPGSETGDGVSTTDNPSDATTTATADDAAQPEGAETQAEAATENNPEQDTTADEHMNEADPQSNEPESTNENGNANGNGDIPTWVLNKNYSELYEDYEKIAAPEYVETAARELTLYQFAQSYVDDLREHEAYQNDTDTAAAATNNTASEPQSAASDGGESPTNTDANDDNTDNETTADEDIAADLTRPSCLRDDDSEDTDTADTESEDDDLTRPSCLRDDDSEDTDTADTESEADTDGDAISIDRSNLSFLDSDGDGDTTTDDTEDEIRDATASTAANGQSKNGRSTNGDSPEDTSAPDEGDATTNHDSDSRSTDVATDAVDTDSTTNEDTPQGAASSGTTDHSSNAQPDPDTHDKREQAQTQTATDRRESAENGSNPETHPNTRTTDDSEENDTDTESTPSNDTTKEDSTTSDSTSDTRTTDDIDPNEKF